LICKGCGETYDEEMFPVCPFCLTENRKTEIDSIENDSNLYNVDNESVHQELEASDIDNDACIENETDTNKNETCIKDINIVDVDALSMRSKNILRRNGIFKLSDLTNFLEQHELRDINGLGSSCEDEIEAALKIEIANDSNAEIFSAKIEEIYLENKYFLFVNYCHSKGIEYMSDLEGFNFSDLSGVRGIGKGKIEDIISRYEQYDSGNFGNNIESEKREKKIEKTIFNFINEQLEDIDIDFLTGLGIKLKVVAMLISNGYKKLGDIEGISTKTLLHIVGDRNFVKFEGIEDELKKTLFEIFDDVLFAQSKEDFCIDIKRACGYTLQELGNEYGLTRERIRQKIAKFNSNLDSFMKPIVALFMSPKNYITVQELLDIYDNDDYDKAILYWCKNSDDLEYLEFAEVFVYAQEERNAVENQIETIAEEFIGDGINLYDNLEELEDLMQNSGFPYMDGSSFINLIQQHGYKVYGDFVVKGRQSYGYLCARVVAEKFPNGIKIYDGCDLDKLRTYAAEEYGDLGIPDSNRAFSTRLSDYLILSGRGMATAESNIHIEMSVLDEIKEYIDNAQEGEINYAEVFSVFEGKLRMLSNIDNYNFLHGVLKLYYSDEYDFSSRDYLKKRGSGYKSGKLSAKIKELIENTGVPIHKNEIKKKLPGLTDIVLINTILSDDDLTQWDYNHYFSISLININDTEKEYIKDEINKLLNQNDGYCSDRLLYDEIKRYKPDILMNNKVETVNNLFFLCQKLFSEEFDFRRPHISRQGLLEEMSVKNVALHLLGYPIKLSFSRYQEIADKLKWSPVTTGLVFSEIETDYARINDDMYIKRDAFDISEDAVNEIRQVLRRKMSKGYLSLINFDDWEDFPDVPYEWNVFLLRTIVNIRMSDLRIVEIKTKDRRYERGIVIEANSDIIDYTDLIISFLKNMGMKEVSENNMLTLLVMNNLTYKMIPKELYVSDKLKYINEKFLLPE
jgi:hypothetical protein